MAGRCLDPIAPYQAESHGVCLYRVCVLLVTDRRVCSDRPVMSAVYDHLTHDGPTLNALIVTLRRLQERLCDRHSHAAP
jgi:hypothetical protein